MKRKKFGKGILEEIRKSFITKVVAAMMALFLLFDVAFPTMSWALTGGP